MDLNAIIEKLKRDSIYWAPEVRTSKLIPYLNEHGMPLYEALCALPAEEREVLGVDKVLIA